MNETQTELLFTQHHKDLMDILKEKGLDGDPQWIMTFVLFWDMHRRIHFLETELEKAQTEKDLIKVPDGSKVTIHLDTTSPFDKAMLDTIRKSVRVPAKTDKHLIFDVTHPDKRAIERVILDGVNESSSLADIKQAVKEMLKLTK